MRTLIRGCRGTIGPISDFYSLRKAHLESVGSYAFFLHGPGRVDIYYAAASVLSRRSTKKNGKVLAVGTCFNPSPADHECLSVYGNLCFAYHLFDMWIGTPIIAAGRASTPSAGWLAQELRIAAAEARAENRPSQLADMLADMLSDNQSGQVPPNATANFGSKTLLIMGINSSPSQLDYRR